MNNLKSYTEYAVSTPTTDFVIGFDFNYGTDAVNVTVDGVSATEAGYSVIYLNSTTIRLNPAVPSGVVRLQRETDIDVPDNQFTAGAKFIASNMDENFTQLRHSQQEVRDGFEKLSEDTYEIIDTLQVVGQAAQDAADAAEQAAQTANDAAAQVNDKVSYQDLDTAVDNAIVATPHNNFTDRDVAGAHPASAILDGGGKTQQEINDAQGIKNNESVSTADFGSVGIAQNIPVSDWYTQGSAYYRGYADLAAVQVNYPHVTSATNTVDWAAAQAAVNHQGAYNQCLIDGCLFFAQGETLVLPLGFRLFGKDPNLFINTNSGNYFVGSLTGQIPKYGIYYDGTTGVAISAAAGVCLEDFHLFGKGYTVADGSVHILDIGDANVYDTVGVEVAKFITTRNMSVFYLGTAFNTVGGNYYSRFYNTEVTRCNKAFSYTVTTYNQHFYGCIIRNTPTPFFFASGVACRNFNYFGGSIEGYRPKDGNIYAIGVPANSIMRFEGVYFENLDTFGTFDSAFGFKGGDCYLQFNGCTTYLNHYSNWVRQTGFSRIRVKSTGNEFYLSSGSRTKNPVIYNLNFTEGSSYLYTDGTDKLPYQTSTPAFTAQGDISEGSNSLVVSDASTMFVGMRVRSTVDTSYETTIRAISGNTLTLQAPAPSNMTMSLFQFYLSPQYIPFSTGAGLLASHSIVFPDKYFATFDYLNFSGRNGENRGALARAPYSPFNGGVNSVSTYVADYANWNPSGKSDGRGAYPVVFRGGKYFPQLGSFAGSFTFATGTAFTVADTNVAAASKIMLMPTNAAAATLLKNGVYISAKANNTSFTVTALTPALGTETFDYTITD